MERIRKKGFQAEDLKWINDVIRCNYEAMISLIKKEKRLGIGERIIPVQIIWKNYETVVDDNDCFGLADIGQV